MNGAQVQTTGATIVAAAAGFAAGRGWLGLDATSWTTIFGALASIAVLIWPAFATRVQALRNTVAKSGDVVVTSTANANALPNNPNVVPATPAINREISKQQ